MHFLLVAAWSRACWSPAFTETCAEPAQVMTELLCFRVVVSHGTSYIC